MNINDPSIARVLPAGPRRLDVSGQHAASLAVLLVDAVVIVSLSLLTGIAYERIELSNPGDISTFVGTGVLVAIIYCGMTRFLGDASPLDISRASGRARNAAVSWVSTFLFLAFIAFTMKVGEVFSRGAVLSLFAFGLPLVVAMKVFVPRILSRTLSTNALRASEIILVGPAEASEFTRLTADLRALGCRGVHTIEFNNGCGKVDWPVERQRMLQRILSVAHRSGPGEIHIVSAGVSQERLSSILAGLRLVPRAIFVIPDDAVANLLRFAVRPLGATVAIEIRKVPLSAGARAAKRSIDIGIASIALLFAAPFLAIVAVAIKIDSSGPVFFRQRRNGCRGRQFRIVKFRTMTVMEDGDVVPQAARDDRRVTRVGRLLRKSSIDELPQLWNVLRGDMSLVGPRPHAVAHDDLYAKLIENYELRQHVKPGITGWAQVNGLRGETPTVDLMYRRIEFDLWYAANCSLALDLLILARTPFALMRQDLAY